MMLRHDMPDTSPLLRLLMPSPPLFLADSCRFSLSPFRHCSALIYCPYRLFSWLMLISLLLLAGAIIASLSDA